MRAQVNGRCLWCNQRGGALENVGLPSELDGQSEGTVHAEHRQPLVSFMELVERRKNLFVGLVLALVFLMMNSTILGLAVGWTVGVLVMGVTLLGLGAVTWFMPFATPQTVQMMGVRRSIIVARACAAGVGIFGLVLLVLACTNSIA